MSLDGYRTVAFDQRGFGETSWVPEPYIDWRDAVAVMDHLEMDSAVIVGCSLGGGIALHLALAVPDRVRALVLIGAAARGWEPVDGWTDLPEWDEALAASKAGDLERVLELDASIWLAGADRSLEDIDPKLIELFIEMDRTPASTGDERDELVESFDQPVNERLADIHAPALAMVGAHDQSEMIESAEYLAGRLSDRPHVVIEEQPISRHWSNLRRSTGHSSDSSPRYNSMRVQSRGLWYRFGHAHKIPRFYLDCWGTLRDT